MKSELSRIAHQYAVAAFEVATAQNIADALLTDLQRIKDTLDAIEDLKTVLNHPAIPAQEKKKLLIDQFKDQIQELSLRLIEMLADRRRIELLPYIETQYRECVIESKGIIRAVLTSAHEVSEQETKTIKAALTKKLGKEPELEIKVDPSLIAGMQLAVGDQVLDGSIKTKLAEMERSLLSV
jgi:F-type H+-transporting ATPase subunit delta